MTTFWDDAKHNQIFENFITYATPVLDNFLEDAKKSYQKFIENPNYETPPYYSGYRPLDSGVFDADIKEDNYIIRIRIWALNPYLSIEIIYDRKIQQFYCHRKGESVETFDPLATPHSSFFLKIKLLGEYALITHPERKKIWEEKQKISSIIPFSFQNFHSYLSNPGFPENEKKLFMKILDYIENIDYNSLNLIEQHDFRRLFEFDLRHLLELFLSSEHEKHRNLTSFHNSLLSVYSFLEHLVIRNSKNLNKELQKVEELFQKRYQRSS